MKYTFTLFLVLLGFCSFSQQKMYEADVKYPYGRLNPSAPEATADYELLIGTCDCKFVSRNAEGMWQDTVRTEWQFKYIMKGSAVQDEVWRENGLMAGSIRQYNADSAKWYVSYYTSVSTRSTKVISCPG